MSAAWKDVSHTDPHSSPFVASLTSERLAEIEAWTAANLRARAEYHRRPNACTVGGWRGPR